MQFKHEDPGGIRALAWNGSLLALGGGQLGTSFYDVTANAWLQHHGYTLPPSPLTSSADDSSGGVDNDPVHASTRLLFSSSQSSSRAPPPNTSSE